MIPIIKSPLVIPSLKGSGILLMSWLLDILTDNSRSEILFWLSLLLTILGIWDYILKIRWKQKQDREAKQLKNKGNDGK